MNYYLLVLTLLCTTVYAQSPSKMSYQAVIRNGSGDLVINSSVKLRMSLLQGSIEGTEVYSEIHTSTTNTNGLITLEIGGGTVISGVFETIDWSNGPYFMKREVDPDGGSNYTIVGTSQLLSVPYAMYANVADTVLNIPDTSSTNEIQELSVSTTGDTLYLSNSNYVIIPGLSNSNSPTITDFDGNVYKTVVIGNQVWFAENLKTTTYNDGELIPDLKDDLSWVNDTLGARTFFNSFALNIDSSQYVNTYGFLYNWYAVGSNKLCPNGWHVPTDEDWTNLTTFLGGRFVAADKLKEAGTMHWSTTTPSVTNETGFTALPSANREADDGYFNIPLGSGWWWSSTQVDNISAWHRGMIGGEDAVYRIQFNKKMGFAVRCIKD